MEYREFIIHKLLPAIREKWPQNKPVKIKIQQDNARPHISLSDPEFLEAVYDLGMNIELVCQPPNSPDLKCAGFRIFQCYSRVTA